jgi:chemotaxis protein MotC
MTATYIVPSREGRAFREKWRRAARLAGGSLLAAVFLAGQLSATQAETAPDPHAMMRRLQALQDQMARGDMQAAALRPGYRSEIEKVLLQSTPQDAERDSYLEVALILVLSGGRAALLEPYLPKDATTTASDGAHGGSPNADAASKAAAETPDGASKTEGDEHSAARALDPELVRGVYAYGMGRSAEAADRLLTLEARALPPGLAAHFALVQGLLAMSYSPDRARYFLDEARLLAPGTLIEEAALRHKIEFAAVAEDLAMFEQTSARYFSRFNRSVFLQTFVDKFATVMTERSNPVSTLPEARIEAFFEKIAPAARSRAYLGLAERALLGGLPQLGNFAARKAAGNLPFGSADYERSLLFQGIAQTVLDSSPDGPALLSRVARNRLDSADAELLDAALAIGAAIRAEATADPGATPLGDPFNGDAAADAGAPLVQSVNRTRQRIAEVDAMMGSALMPKETRR